MTSFEQAKNSEGGNERIRLHNQFQFALVHKHYGYEIGDDELSTWVEKYSPAFGELVKEKPEILELFRDAPDTALAEAEEFLYISTEKGRS